MKHTPGPWEMGTQDIPTNWQGVYVSAIGNHKGIVAVAYACCAANTEANAQLIAAAPELLEACKLAYAAETNHSFSYLRNKIKQAIAKAEGKEV